MPAEPSAGGDFALLLAHAATRPLASVPGRAMLAALALAAPDPFDPDPAGDAHPRPDGHDPAAQTMAQTMARNMARRRAMVAGRRLPDGPGQRPSRFHDAVATAAALRLQGFGNVSERAVYHGAQSKIHAAGVDRAGVEMPVAGHASAPNMIFRGQA